MPFLKQFSLCQPDEMVCQIVLTLLSKAVSQCQFIYMAEMERVPRLSPQVDCHFQPTVFPMSLLGVILAMMVRAKMMMKKNCIKMVPRLPKEKSLIPGLCIMPKSISFHPQLQTLEVGY
jgi:hypothetical protein